MNDLQQVVKTIYLSAGEECVPEVLLEVTQQPAHSGEEEKKNSLLRLWGSGHGQLPTPALLLAGPPGPAYGCAALPAAGATLGCPHGGRSYTLLCSPLWGSCHLH